MICLVAWADMARDSKSISACYREPISALAWSISARCWNMTSQMSWRRKNLKIGDIVFPIISLSDVQGQLTPQSVVLSGRISNSFELSCMSSLPASIKRNGWKKLVELCPSILKILSKNQFLTSIKGRNSFANLRKMTLYNSNI